MTIVRDVVKRRNNRDRAIHPAALWSPPSSAPSDNENVPAAVRSNAVSFITAFA
jgi:hypothetical protein